MEDLGGLRIVGAGRPAADVGLVRAIAGEGDQSLAREDGPRDDPVRQVVAARHVGIVQQEGIVRRDPPAKGLEQRAHREAAAAGMDRDAVGLGDQRALGIGEEAGEVVALVEDRAARGADHHPAHLLGDLVQPVLHEREGDGIGHIYLDISML